MKIHCAFQCKGWVISNSKVLAFGLSAAIKHQLISQRTKEALSRMKSEGKQLGRPKGRLSEKTKLTGKEDEIKIS